VEPVRSARLPVAVGLLACLLLPGEAHAAGAPFQRTWHSDQIRLSPALNAGYDGHGVTVAVLDGWVDTSHPDFEKRAVQAADCTSGTCRPGVSRDDCGQDHGTHVAGTIASSSYGVATKAKLLAIRVLARDSSGDCAGDPQDVAAGIHWAVAHGARVINLSLGPDVPGAANTSAIPSAVQDAAAAGVVVVFSAGNKDLPVAQSYGGNALVVAATNRSGALADYSQHGEGVSVAAPGGEPTGVDADGNAVCKQDRSDCVTSLYPGNQYAVAAGTSMAAPQVAGLAALLFQQRPGRSRADVINRITGTAHALAGAGAGRIDVAAALGIKTTPSTSKPTATRTSSPRPHVVASPRRPTVRTAVSPSPLPPRPTPAATTLTPSPTPSATTSPPTLAAPPALADDEIPPPLAGIAGALIGLAATAVLVFGRR
jgi:subtilisin family serine protease